MTGEHARLTPQSFLLASVKTKILKRTYKSEQRTWDSVEKLSTRIYSAGGITGHPREVCIAEDAEL